MLDTAKSDHVSLPVDISDHASPSLSPTASDDISIGVVETCTNVPTKLADADDEIAEAPANDKTALTSPLEAKLIAACPETDFSR